MRAIQRMFWRFYAQICPNTGKNMCCEKLAKTESVVLLTRRWAETLTLITFELLARSWNRIPSFEESQFRWNVTVMLTPWSSTRKRSKENEKKIAAMKKKLEMCEVNVVHNVCQWINGNTEAYDFSPFNPSATLPSQSPFYGIWKLIASTYNSID